MPNFSKSFLHVLATGFLMVALQVVAWSAHPQLVGFHGQPQTQGFDSALWQQFYLPDLLDQGEQGSSAPRRSPDLAGAENRQARFILARTRKGHVDEAALADVIVEAQQTEADDADGAAAILSDWQMVKLKAVGGYAQSADAVGPGGPGATTLLVGLVAGIVACGAMFSGRQ